MEGDTEFDLVPPDSTEDENNIDAPPRVWNDGTARPTLSEESIKELFEDLDACTIDEALLTSPEATVIQCSEEWQKLREGRITSTKIAPFVHMGEFGTLHARG